MTSALVPKILSTPSPTTGITETTAPVTLIGTVTTLVKTQPDKNTINKVSEISLFIGLYLK
jgi:hypothetical protein